MNGSQVRKLLNNSSPTNAIDLGLLRGRTLFLFLSNIVDAAPISLIRLKKIYGFTKS